jgi:hypothetical protein
MAKDLGLMEAAIINELYKTLSRGRGGFLKNMIFCSDLTSLKSD